MEKRGKILSGPGTPSKEFSGSLAENLIPWMRDRAKDHIAQVDGETGESITTREFLKMSLEIAEGLIDIGLEGKDVVALLSPNSIRSVATAMGVWFAGAILAPVDYNLKPHEMQHLLKQFQPKYLICENKKSEEIQKCLKQAELNPKIIILDSKCAPNGEFVMMDDIRKNVDVDKYVPRKVPDPKKQPAVILCSSGSTGLPKGVALSHYCLLCNCSVGEEQNVGASFFVVTSPLFWISGVMLFLISCYAGAPRYIPKPTDPEDVLRGIQNYRPFFILISPSSLLELLGHPKVKNYDLSSLQIIFSAGAPLGVNGAKKIKEVLPDAVIASTYGLTETTGSIVTLEGSFKDMILGKVLPGVEIKVVDVDTGEILGPNKPGECRVKTRTIMIGYYNNEEATKAAFDEDGWFRTGDIVYYDEDEVLYIVGRIKEVVKYRNYQVSLSELEAFIIGVPGVKDVAVVPIRHEEDTFHLKALVVKQTTSDITAEDIVKIVAENYSPQKHLHEGVEFVDSLPRSAVGKLKRAELIKRF